MTLQQPTGQAGTSLYDDTVGTYFFRAVQDLIRHTLFQGQRGLIENFLNLTLYLWVGSIF